VFIHTIHHRQLPPPPPQQQHLSERWVSPSLISLVVGKRTRILYLPHVFYPYGHGMEQRCRKAAVGSCFVCPYFLTINQQEAQLSLADKPRDALCNMQRCGWPPKDAPPCTTNTLQYSVPMHAAHCLQYRTERSKVDACATHFRCRYCRSKPVPSEIRRDIGRKLRILISPPVLQASLSLEFRNCM